MTPQIIKQIVTLIQENHFDEARGVISRVAAVQSSEPAILKEVGKLSFLLGDLSEAENTLRASISLNQGDADSHYQLGLILLKESKPDLALASFKQACDYKSDFALAHFHWGLTLYQLGNMQEALSQFTLATQIDKSLFAAFYYSGLVYQYLHQDEQACQHFEQIIAQHSDFAPAYNALGVSYYNLGKTEEATVCFQRACKLIPDLSAAQFNLANIFAKIGKYEAAQVHYHEALTSPELSANERAIIYNNLAVVSGQLNQWEKSSEYILQAQSISPDIVEIQVNSGLILIALHEYDLAANAFELILQNVPNHFEANFYGGMAILCLGQYSSAQAKLALAASFLSIPNQSSTLLSQQLFLWYGYACLANKEYNLAKDQLDKIVALDKEVNKKLLCLAYDALGLCSTFLNNQTDALECFGKCLRIDPDLSIAYMHRAHSYEASGQEELAKKDFLAALKLDPDCLEADKDYIAHLLEGARIEEAMAHAIKVVTLKPEDIGSKLLLAKSLQKKSAYTDALATLSGILKDSPDNADAYTMLGQIHMSQGDFAQADEVFQKAAQLPNVEAELFLSWARALAYLGFHELALEKFKLAADINPYDGDIYESWAQALKSLGRFEEASEVYRVASSYL